MITVNIVGVVPSHIGRPMLGVKLLGGDVSQDRYFIEGLTRKRVAPVAELKHLLPH